jgi:hypothetical protein
MRYDMSYDDEGRKIRLKCPQCGRHLQGATSRMIGDIGVCPKCKAEFTIEAPQEQRQANEVAVPDTQPCPCEGRLSEEEVHREASQSSIQRLKSSMIDRWRSSGVSEKLTVERMDKAVAVFVVVVISVSIGYAVKENIPKWRRMNRIYQEVRIVAEGFTPPQWKGPVRLAQKPLPPYAVWITGDDFGDVPHCAKVYKHGALWKCEMGTGSANVESKVKFVVYTHLRRSTKEELQFDTFRDEGLGTMTRTGGRRKLEVQVYHARAWVIDVRNGKIIGCGDFSPMDAEEYASSRGRYGDARDDMPYQDREKVISPDDMSFRVLEDVDLWGLYDGLTAAVDRASPDQPSK